MDTRLARHLAATLLAASLTQAAAAMPRLAFARRRAGIRARPPKKGGVTKRETTPARDQIAVDQIYMRIP
jgi:hypothetical protein